MRWSYGRKRARSRKFKPHQQANPQLKLLTEYLERALEFEALAENEANESFILKQAAAYRRTAVSAPSNMDFPRPSSLANSLSQKEEEDPLT